MTPLLTEWLAVSPALTGRAVRSGRSRGLPSEFRAHRHQDLPKKDAVAPEIRDGAVLVAGVAGAVAPGLRPGELVVADAVVDRRTGARFELPVAPLLAGALRRAGQTVHVGPIVTTERVVDDPAERARLAAEGFVAVDTESSLLLADGRPAAVVRAIVDTPEHKLVSLGTARRGVAALAALRRAAPVLQRWLDAIADREVLLAAPRSFCAGVERAIDIVDRALDRFDEPVYVRREIVHNRHVVAELEQKGAIFVEEVDEVPEEGLVVLAAHGVAPVVREDAARRRLHVIDATCPLVAKVHAEVKRFAGRGDTIFLIGHDHHEEVVGTLGEAPDRVIVVNDHEEAMTVEAPDPDKVAYVMQTTLAVDEAEKTATILRERFPALTAPRKDDVCYATTNRQQAVREVARASDLVIVLGSRNSSNSLRLVEVAEGEGARAHLVDDLSEIDLAWLVGADRVGVTAGASAPPKLVDEVVAGLAGLGRITMRETEVVSENVRFTLPREVS